MREDKECEYSMLHTENLVWLPVEQTYGFIVGPMGAYYSTIRYNSGGMEFEVLMENNEFELREEGPFEYESD